MESFPHLPSDLSVALSLFPSDTLDAPAIPATRTNSPSHEDNEYHDNADDEEVGREDEAANPTVVSSAITVDNVDDEWETVDENAAFRLSFDVFPMSFDEPEEEAAIEEGEEDEIKTEGAMGDQNEKVADEINFPADNHYASLPRSINPLSSSSLSADHHHAAHADTSPGAPTQLISSQPTPCAVNTTKISLSSSSSSSSDLPSSDSSASNTSNFSQLTVPIQTQSQQPSSVIVISAPLSQHSSLPPLEPASGSSRSSRRVSDRERTISPTTETEHTSNQSQNDERKQLVDNPPPGNIDININTANQPFAIPEAPIRRSEQYARHFSPSSNIPSGSLPLSPPSSLRSSSSSSSSSYSTHVSNPPEILLVPIPASQLLCDSQVIHMADSQVFDDPTYLYPMRPSQQNHNQTAEAVMTNQRQDNDRHVEEDNSVVVVVVNDAANNDNLMNSEHLHLRRTKSFEFSIPSSPLLELGAEEAHFVDQKNETETSTEDDHESGWTDVHHDDDDHKEIISSKSDDHNKDMANSTFQSELSLDLPSFSLNHSNDQPKPSTIMTAVKTITTDASKPPATASSPTLPMPSTPLAASPSPVTKVSHSIHSDPAIRKRRMSNDLQTLIDARNITSRQPAQTSRPITSAHTLTDGTNKVNHASNLVDRSTRLQLSPTSSREGKNSIQPKSNKENQPPKSPVKKISSRKGNGKTHRQKDSNNKTGKKKRKQAQSKAVVGIGVSSHPRAAKKVAKERLAEEAKADRKKEIDDDDDFIYYKPATNIKKRRPETVKDKQIITTPNRQSKKKSPRSSISTSSSASSSSSTAGAAVVSHPLAEEEIEDITPSRTSPSSFDGIGDKRRNSVLNINRTNSDGVDNENNGSNGNNKKMRQSSLDQFAFLSPTSSNAAKVVESNKKSIPTTGTTRRPFTDLTNRSVLSLSLSLSSPSLQQQQQPSKQQQQSQSTSKWNTKKRLSNPSITEQLQQETKGVHDDDHHHPPTRSMALLHSTINTHRMANSVIHVSEPLDMFATLPLSNAESQVFEYHH